MKLNLGSCDNLMPGYLNVDAFDFGRPGFDFQQISLNQNWPFGESVADEIRAHDIFEHIWPTDGHGYRLDIAPKTWVMNQAWRTLKPGGILSLIVPTTDGRGAFQDPTHVTWWTPNDMFYFCNHWAEWKRFRDAYGIQAEFSVVEPNPPTEQEAERGYRQAFDRDDAWRMVERGHSRVANAVTKLHVHLMAVK